MGVGGVGFSEKSRKLSSRTGSAHIFLMGVADVALLDVRVPERRVDLGVAKQDLDLLYRHPLVYRAGREGPAEAVRMDVLDFVLGPQIPYHLFYGIHGEPFVAAPLSVSAAAHEQGLVLVLPGL